MIKIAVILLSAQAMAMHWSPYCYTPQENLLGSRLKDVPESSGSKISLNLSPGSPENRKLFGNSGHHVIRSSSNQDTNLLKSSTGRVKGSSKKREEANPRKPPVEEVREFLASSAKKAQAEQEVAFSFNPQYFSDKENAIKKDILTLDQMIAEKEIELKEKARYFENTRLNDLGKEEALLFWINEGERIIVALKERLMWIQDYAEHPSLKRINQILSQHYEILQLQKKNKLSTKTAYQTEQDIYEEILKNYDIEVSALTLQDRVWGLENDLKNASNKEETLNVLKQERKEEYLIIQNQIKDLEKRTSFFKSKAKEGLKRFGVGKIYTTKSHIQAPAKISVISEKVSKSQAPKVSSKISSKTTKELNRPAWSSVVRAETKNVKYRKHT